MSSLHSWDIKNNALRDNTTGMYLSDLWPPNTLLAGCLQLDLTSGWEPRLVVGVEYEDIP